MFRGTVTLALAGFLFILFPAIIEEPGLVVHPNELPAIATVEPTATPVATPTATPPPTATPLPDALTSMKNSVAADELWIDVYLSARQLSLYRGQELLRGYTVAIGAPDTPTPVDRWRISEKITNPGPGTQFGTRWMRIDALDPATGKYRWTDYGIHGTDEPDKIGLEVSNGCVRLVNAQVEELFSLVPMYTQVITRE
ncbi:MAG: L,D-transpeptidase [Chloroflexi bacterium]|nr:L,D-transpeptidase [Chloroflexota bacterium]